MTKLPRSWFYLAGALAIGVVLTRVRVRPLTVVGVVLVVGVLLYAASSVLGHAGRGKGRAPARPTARALDPAPPGPGPAVDTPSSRDWLREHRRRLTRVLAGCLALSVVLAAVAAVAFLVTDPGHRPGWPAVVLAVACLAGLGTAVAAFAGLVQCHRARRALGRSPWRAVTAQAPAPSRRRRSARDPATPRDVGPVRLTVDPEVPVVVHLRAFTFAMPERARWPVSSDGHRATAWYVGDDSGNGVLASPGGGNLLRTRAPVGTSS